MKENSGRAVRSEPPADFERAKSKWTRLVSTSFPQLGYLGGNGAGNSKNNKSAGNGRGGGGGRPFQPQGGSGSGTGGGGLSTPKAIHNGRPVCYNFNQASGCGRKQGAPDACVDKKGSLFAHYCNYFVRNSGRHCYAQHLRVRFH